MIIIIICHQCHNSVATITCLNEQIQQLQEQNKIMREALELIASPSEFNCAVGEGNLRSTAREALKKGGGLT